MCDGYFPAKHNRGGGAYGGGGGGGHHCDRSGPSMSSASAARDVTGFTHSTHTGRYSIEIKVFTCSEVQKTFGFGSFHQSCH